MVINSSRQVCRVEGLEGFSLSVSPAKPFLELYGDASLLERRREMNLLGFTAEASLHHSRDRYGFGHSNPFAQNKIIPQDCDFFKKTGCVSGPFSWCAPAGLGGAVPFWDCVDKLSGGNCLDCIGSADPRDKDLTGPPNDYGGIDYGSDKGFFGHGTQGLTSGGGPRITVDPPPSMGQRDSDVDRLQRQLNRIERCACDYEGVVQAPQSSYGQYYAAPVR